VRNPLTRFSDDPLTRFSDLSRLPRLAVWLAVDDPILRLTSEVLPILALRGTQRHVKGGFHTGNCACFAGNQTRYIC